MLQIPTTLLTRWPFFYGVMGRYREAFIFLLLIVSAAVRAETAVFFTPSTACEEQIAARIDAAQASIDIAIYSFTHRRLAAAVQAASARGMRVRILADRRQAAGRGAQVLPLYRAGLNVRVHTIHQTQHNKFAVFDGTAVVTGSYNWTYNASRRNDENCLFIDNEPETVSRYREAFERLWAANPREMSEHWFRRHVEKTKERE